MSPGTCHLGTVTGTAGAVGAGQEHAAVLALPVAVLDPGWCQLPPRKNQPKIPVVRHLRDAALSETPTTSIASQNRSGWKRSL